MSGMEVTMRSSGVDSTGTYSGVSEFEAPPTVFRGEWDEPPERSRERSEPVPDGGAVEVEAVTHREPAQRGLLAGLVDWLVSMLQEIERQLAMALN